MLETRESEALLVSDTHHPDYDDSLIFLSAKREALFADLRLELNGRNARIFELACEQIAYSGLNVTYGRLRSEVRRMVDDSELYPKEKP